MIIIIIILKHQSAQISRCWMDNFTLMNLSHMGLFSTSVLSWIANWLIWELFRFISFLSPCWFPRVGTDTLPVVSPVSASLSSKPGSKFYSKTPTPRKNKKMKQDFSSGWTVGFLIPVASARLASVCHGRHKRWYPRPSWANRLEKNTHPW